MTFIAACLAVAWGSAAMAQADQSPVVIAHDGKARLPILVGSVAEPAEELRLYLNRITGGDFASEPFSKSKPGIYVGLTSDFPKLKLDAADPLGPEGFVLRTEGGSLYLVGEQPLGVQHAVTTFLHRVGCRWFFPGEAWEYVPRHQTLQGQWNQRSKPAFATQRRLWYGFGAYAESKRDWADWVRHNRMGGPIDVSLGHTWHGLEPEEDFEEHPEWFALVDGKRQPSKPCYSHPQVLERAIASALRQAANGDPMVSMTPPDGLGYCECELCMAALKGGEPFREHSTLFARLGDGSVVNITSETLFSFVNRVAAAVAEKHPKTLVGCYAYSAYSHPPSFKLHPNVYLQTTTSYRRTPLTLEEQMSAFGEKTEQVGIREYYSVYQWDWDYPSPGRVAPSTLAKDLRFYGESGVTAINAESSNNWAARGLGYYVAAQLMFDLDSNVPALVADFYQKAFGPAAPAMQRYYVRWYGASAAVLPVVRDLPEQCVLYEKGKFDVEALKAAYVDLDDAVSRTTPDSAERRRIDMIRMYMHYLFLRYRLHQAEQTGDEQQIVDAIEAETVFGGRLTNTNMIHTRPLIGKAFLRRFRKHEDLLASVDEAQESGAGWRQIGEPPTAEELESLWKDDKKALEMP